MQNLTRTLIQKNLLFLLLTLIFNVNTVFGYTSVKKLPKDSVIKILAIGNSFSEDAIEHYLYGLAKAGGYKVIIGNLFKGGAPLDLHWESAKSDKPIYEYRKTNVNGRKEKILKTTLSKVLADENWDFISFQQASAKSGLFETYQEPLPLLLNYVKSRATNPNVKYVFHQTWAYAQNSKHKAFPNYENNQIKMYEGIVNASKKAMKTYKFDLLIPAGTTIQNARTSFIGDNFCRDGHHLDKNIGRYTASCAWYEAIFKENVTGNPYKPEKVSEKEAYTVQTAAHKAVKKPFKISRIK